MCQVPLPKLYECCYCIDLKVGVFLICIYTLFATAGAGTYFLIGPCFEVSNLKELDLSSGLGRTSVFANFVVFVCAICILIYLIFDIEELQFAVPIYSWCAIVLSISTIGVSIIQYVVTSKASRKKCQWMIYVAVLCANSLVWLYCALVMNSYDDE